MTRRMRRGGRQPSRKAEILAAAARVFNRLGYHQATMQQIADEAALLKGSIYHYFGSKHELLFLLSRDPLHAMVERLRALAAADRTAREKVAEGIALHIGALAQHYPDLMAIIGERDDSLPEEMRAEIVQLRREYHTLWKSVIQEGVLRGELAPDLDVSVTVNYLLGALNWMHRWYRRDGRLSPEELAAHFSRLLLYGMLARAGVQGKVGSHTREHP